MSFNWIHYKYLNQDLLLKTQEACLRHYNMKGKNEQRKCNIYMEYPDFDYKQYALNYSDLSRFDKSFLENHWLQYGRTTKENRTYKKKEVINNIINNITNTVKIDNMKEIIKIDNMEEIIKINNLSQIYISNSLIHFKNRVCNKYNLSSYVDKMKPSLFFGLYNRLDFNIIEQHKSDIYIILGGSDVPNCSYLKNPNIKFIAISQNIQDRLLKLNKNCIRVYFNLVNHNLFKPIDNLGNKIFIYDGIIKKQDNGIIYGKKYYDDVCNILSDYEYIFSSDLNLPYEKMPDIYAQCFIGLRLTSNDGNANMVQEMAAMKIPVVHNHSEYGLKWSNVNDIVNHIKNKKNINIHQIKELDTYKLNLINDNIILNTEDNNMISIKLYEQKNKIILINTNTNLNYIAGDTIMISNLMNILMKNNNKVILLSNYKTTNIFTRNLEYNNYSIYTELNNNNIITQINLLGENSDIIFIRNHKILLLLKNILYQNKIVLYGLDVHLDGIKYLNNNFNSVITQSEKLKQLYIDNGINENKIYIVEPISYYYYFNLPERNNNELRLIYSGTLRNEENILEIINEFKKIHYNKPNIFLTVIYGKIHGDYLFTQKINNYIKEKVTGIKFKHNLSHRDTCYEIANSDIGICWRKNGWGENGEVSTKVKEYELYGLKIVKYNITDYLNTEYYSFLNNLN